MKIVGNRTVAASVAFITLAAAKYFDIPVDPDLLHFGQMGSGGLVALFGRLAVKKLEKRLM